MLVDVAMQMKAFIVSSVCNLDHKVLETTAPRMHFQLMSRPTPLSVFLLVLAAGWFACGTLDLHTATVTEKSGKQPHREIDWGIAG